MAIAHAILGSEETCALSQGSCPVGQCAGNDDDVRKVVLDVPEIDTQEILGEWLIPRGEALLVSFGAHTVADKDGMAVVKERLAIIEADEANTAIAMIATEADQPRTGSRVHAECIRIRATPSCDRLADRGKCVHRAVLAAAGGRAARTRDGNSGTAGGSARAKPVDSSRRPRRRHAGRTTAPAARRDRTGLLLVRVVRADAEPADEEDSSAETCGQAGDRLGHEQGGVYPAQGSRHVRAQPVHAEPISWLPVPHADQTAVVQASL